MSVRIYDGQGLDVVGGNATADTLVASPAHAMVGYRSKLPLVVGVASGAVDGDAISFSYNGVNWDSSDSTVHKCQLGGWDSGSRQGDCGFTCT